MSYIPPPSLPPSPAPPLDPRYSSIDKSISAFRAAVVVWFVGALGMLCGGYMTVLAWTAPVDETISIMRSLLSQEQLDAYKQMHISLEEFVRISQTLGAMLQVLVGLLLIVLGIFVRRASRGASITSLIILIPILLIGCLNALSAMVAAATGHPEVLVVGILWLLAGIAICFGIVSLWRIIRATGAEKQFRLMQMMQMRQATQALQQPGGYGYGSIPASFGPTPLPGSQTPIGPLVPPPQDSYRPPNL